MDVLAPFPSFVRILHVTSGSEVSFGADIITLDTDDEQHELQRIANLRSLLQLTENGISENRLTGKKRILELAKQTAEGYKDYLDRAVLIARDRHVSGEISELDVKQLEAELNEAASQVEKSKILLEEFKVTASANLEMIGLSRKQLDDDEKLIKARIGNTTIRSPMKGKITLHCGVGSFVDTGTIVAVIA